MVTMNPAAMLGMSETIGTIKPGLSADLSILEIIEGRFELSDNSGVSVQASEMINPIHGLRDGVIYEANSPLIPPVSLFEVAA